MSSIPNLAQMIINFSTAYPQLMRLATATSYVVGMWFMTSALAGMRHVNLPGQQQQQHEPFPTLLKKMIGGIGLVA